jgi:hypothetical protein
MKKVKFRWDERYSSTMQPDDMGRWARIGYVGNPKIKEGKYTLFEVAWIKQKEHNNEILFVVSPLFPYKSKYLFNSLDDAKVEIEKEFNWFIGNLKYKYD